MSKSDVINYTRLEQVRGTLVYRLLVQALVEHGTDIENEHSGLEGDNIVAQFAANVVCVVGADGVRAYDVNMPSCSADLLAQGFSEERLQTLWAQYILENEGALK